MSSTIKSHEEASSLLGDSISAWETLVGYIRANYAMDEHWFEGKPDSNYRNELKFRRGGKTLVTLCAREGFFNVVIILGKAERAKFEEQQTAFSDSIRKLYADTETYHDGKWLLIGVQDSSVTEDIVHLLHIKRKPSRKTNALMK
ncbi:MAG: DUF3788 domain-containing protein [Oscillospiraceae bacterium]|jgi:hypothetical protein|nr:DUF3788 domain-containing protein [Oscillospiraceae bacterium]